MIWKASKNNSPVIGDQRTKVKWAWFPVKATCPKKNQEYWVWMGWYNCTQEFMRYECLVPARPAATVVGWCTIEKTIDTTEYIGKKW